jgi:hypothetical protein
MYDALLLLKGQKMTILVGMTSAKAKVRDSFRIDGAARLTDSSCRGTSCRQHGPYIAIPLQASKCLLLPRILAMPYSVRCSGDLNSCPPLSVSLRWRRLGHTRHLVATTTCLACALGSIASCIAAAALSISPVGLTHGTFGQDRWAQCLRSWEGSCSCTSTPAWLRISVLDHASPRGSWPMCNRGT